MGLVVTVPPENLGVLDVLGVLLEPPENFGVLDVLGVLLEPPENFGVLVVVLDDEPPLKDDLPLEPPPKDDDRPPLEPPLKLPPLPAKASVPLKARTATKAKDNIRFHMRRILSFLRVVTFSYRPFFSQLQPKNSTGADPMAA